MLPAMRRARRSSKLGVARVSRLPSRPPRGRHGSPGSEIDNNWRIDVMKWERPAATDMRFGFEITMYIANR